MIAQSITPEHRARVNSTRWALLSIVSAICSAAFGWMLDTIAFPLNYQAVFGISFALAWLDPYFFSKIRVPPLEREPPTDAQPLGQRLSAYFRPVLAHKRFLSFLACTILYRIALNLPAPLFSLFWVNDLGAPDTLIGLRGTVGNAALVVGYVYWGGVAPKLGYRNLLILSALGLAVYPVLTAFSPSAIWLLPAAALWGATVAGIDVGLFDLMLESMPAQRLPRFVGAYSTVANAAIFVGPLLGAAAAQRSSTASALILAGVLQVLTTLPLLLLPRH